MVKSKIALFVLFLVMLTGCSKAEDESIMETDPMKVIMTEKVYELQELEFPDFNQIPYSSFIMFHGITDNVLYFAYGESDNATIYSTNALYAYDIESKKVTMLKDIQNKFRVLDFVLCDNGDMLYSKVELGDSESDPFHFEIIKESNGKETVLDEGSLFNHLNGPAFSRAGENIFYLLQEVEMDVSTNTANAQIDSLNEITKDGTAVSVWSSQAKVEDHYIVEEEEILISTDPHYSATSVVFYTQKASATEMESTLYYYQDEKLKSKVFKERISTVVPLTNYIVVNTRSASYVIDIKKDTVKEIVDLNMKVYQGVQMKGDKFIYYNEDGNAYIMEIMESGIELSKVTGMKSGFLPRFIVDKHGNVIAGGYRVNDEATQMQTVELYYLAND